MEDVFTKRQKALKQLLQTRFANNQRRLAEALGKSPTYVNFLLADPELPHHKNLGERLAREFEIRLGLMSGSLDSAAPVQTRQVLPIDDQDLPPDFVAVPRRLVKFSAGNGSQVIEEEQAPPLAFRREWLKRNRLTPDKLIVSYAEGDSMEPRIHDGDTMLIDTSHTNLSDGKVYAIRLGDELRVKRVYKKVDSVILRSDNPKYEDDVLTPQQAEALAVLGRVVWVSGSL